MDLAAFRGVVKWLCRFRCVPLEKVSENDALLPCMNAPHTATLRRGRWRRISATYAFATRHSRFLDPLSANLNECCETLVSQFNWEYASLNGWWG